MLRLGAGVAVAALVIICALVMLAPVRAFSAEMICGKASWYGSESGNKTALGDPFNGSSMTGALPVDGPTRLKLGARYRVHYGAAKPVDIRINDTGKFAKYGRIVDLSRAVAIRLGLIGQGTGRVCLERLR